MSPEEQRIAIAESCGITQVGWRDDILLGVENGSIVDVPDFPNDLNAMHVAEHTLMHGSEKWTRYCDNLEKVMGTMNWRELITATAYHRAEAFVRTIGKWKD